jgi:hypothetical protein
MSKKSKKKEDKALIPMFVVPAEQAIYYTEEELLEDFEQGYLGDSVVYRIDLCTEVKVELSIKEVGDE